ncbi:hypothetical protein ASD51_16955 [Streptomyces sp. Root55]|nr:hypothetical protein ASD51_16955 [Streptomyces sp. Root55]
MMTATERREEAAARVRAAKDAVARLWAGSAGVCVTLPSPRTAPVAYAGDRPAPPTGPGRCAIGTVPRLGAGVWDEKRDAVAAHGG